MSESTYPNLPISNPKSTEFYDGSIEIEKAWLEGLKPDPFLSVSEWADKYRILSPKSAAEPGKWRTQRTPYLKEIMDSLSVSSPVQRVVFMKGSQIGGSETGINWLGYIIHMAPGPVMAVSPTVEMAKRSSRQRIDPQLEDVPELRERVAPARSRDSGNTVLSKEFPGGVLVMTGANSAVGLRSMPARYLFMDEVDGFPGDVDGEGDPILLAERRSATFARRRKVMLVSTPTIKSTSRIQREFDTSDQRYFYVPCPHCGHRQPLKFAQLRWTKGSPDEAKYCCESCEELIEEHQKSVMLENGQWVATTQGDGLTQGYHLSSLYSPVGWFSWADAARMFEQAQQSPDLMKGFVNTVLGEAFEEEYDAPEWERLYERREDYQLGVVPEGGLFLTAGVDVQRDRLECEVVAWGRNKESWSVDYIVLDGDTAQSKVWSKLDKVLAKDWLHASGSTMPIRVMAVDSGYATQDVYSWVRQSPQAVWGGAGARASQPRTVVAIKGRDTETALILSVSKADTGSKRRGLRVWNVSGPVAKVELYRWLKLPVPTDEALAEGETYQPGSCHFPQYGEEYFKQLTAEKRVIRLHKGFPKASWEKDPTRNNEALDCRVYARAAASIYGLDRFKEMHWKRLEQALGETKLESGASSLSLSKKPAEGECQSGSMKKRVPVLKPPTVVADDPYLFS
jgi:phage terminase large subunit GpA-like protein